MQNLFSLCISGLRQRWLWLATLLLAPAAIWAAPFAYIANTNSNSVSVVDTASNAVTATIPVAGNP